MNVDGFAHDGFHKVRIPDSLVDSIKHLGFKLPTDNLIEVIDFPKWQNLLCN